MAPYLSHHSPGLQCLSNRQQQQQQNSLPTLATGRETYVSEAPECLAKAPSQRYWEEESLGQTSSCEGPEPVGKREGCWAEEQEQE